MKQNKWLQEVKMKSQGTVKHSLHVWCQVQGPGPSFAHYSNNYSGAASRVRSQLKLISPLIFCNFAVIYWVYFLHLT